jgi:hypothetical protein
VPLADRAGSPSGALKESRLVFTLEANRLTLVRVGGHDEIRRYLRQLWLS